MYMPFTRAPAFDSAYETTPFVSFLISTTMFSSFFSAQDPTAPNFRPVASNVEPTELLGELEQRDTEWACAGGINTETQIFYTLADDGTSFWCQVIHSSVGLWYPQIQFTCKVFNPKTGEHIWKSVNVSNFVTPPPGLDKRSSKSDQFSITYKAASPDSDFPESYTINANLGQDLQIALVTSRPAAAHGFKLGKGPQGGYSYFGPDKEKPEGYVVHRFWPRYQASGHVIVNGAAREISGPGMFVHAIQGMRPDVVAQAWNFAHFQSNALGGVSAIQMEFTTQPSHGRNGAGSGGVVVNVGSILLGGQLASVTAETRWPDDKAAEGSVVSRAQHLNPEKDPDTSYGKPSEILYTWKAPSIVADAPGEVSGELKVDLGSVQAPKGLIEKVDVLGEIPYVAKMAVNYVAGTKPFIYQWVNPATLTVTGPDALAPGLSAGVPIEGTLYNEATFIS
ncbi:hypothetical protein HGRIS_003522 [Hohenbuehelia grisea]|uniref:Survival factor 1 n=1 Tax=Hohenbuehelia grisea TaxID=104357 RepID=A0ABR3JGB2_9AGAR